MIYTDATPSITAAIVAGSVNTTQLTNDGVTYAKLQNVTDNRLLGRSAGSAGDVQELTTGAGLALSGGVLSATTTYEEGTFTLTATGFSGTPPSGTASYVRVGKQVTINLPSLSGTSNATTFTVTGLPVALYPSTAGNLEFMTRGYQDSGHLTALIGVQPSSGLLEVLPMPSLSWATTGTKLVAQTAITYKLP